MPSGKTRVLPVVRGLKTQHNLILRYTLLEKRNHPPNAFHPEQHLGLTYLKLLFNMMFMRVSVHPRLERQHKLYRLAETQHGYFTAAQALRLGYAYQIQQHHRETGNWLASNDLRGIYRLRDYPDDTLERLVEISLWSHDRHGKPQGVIGFQSALVVHQLGGLLMSKIHLIVPSGFRKIPPEDVILHRDHLGAEDVIPFDGFNITTPLRTLADVAGSNFSPEYLETAVRDALERGRVRRLALEERISSLKSHAKARLLAALAVIE